MSTQLQLRRGTTAEHSTFTGAAAEVTVDTDKDTVVVHDGSTAGGVPLAKESAIPTGALASLNSVGAAQIDANAVGSSELANSSVLDAKIDTMSASKLTGTLPAIDGSQLTGIDTGADPHYGIPQISGRCYPNVIGTTGQNWTANILYLKPVFIKSALTVDALMVKIQTGAAGNVRMGLYADNNGVPGNLVIDGGTASVGTTGVKTISISQALSQGIYWIAAVTDTTARPFGDYYGVLGGDGFLSVGNDGATLNKTVGYQMSHTYGALPSSVSNLSETTHSCSIYIKVA